MNDDDYWEIEPRFINLSVCLSKQKPHDRLVLFTIVFEGRLYIVIILNYLPNHSLLWPTLKFSLVDVAI